MPSRAHKACSTPGCPELVPPGKAGRCPDCRRKAERTRGSAHRRGYGTQHRDRFRRGVLDRDPVCVECRAAPATVADHWPRSRRELVELGLDPNDPKHGRGLCHPCHGKATAANPQQRGGWYAEQ
ncbi:holin [Streptomyces sp. SS8]